MPPNLSPADFSFELPEELIARYPNPQRSAARLLRLLPTGAPEHHVFSELPKLLRPDDLLVFNNTKVIPARLYAYKSSGGRLQMLVERLLDARTMLLQIKAASKLQIGSQLRIDGCPQCTLEYIARCGSFYQVRLRQACCASTLELCQRHGEIPLPPYLQRPAEELDQHRYQSLLAREPGAVAAPTASLHFDAPLLQALSSRGIDRVELTLHVGYGTFAPMRSASLQEHRMHTELYQISPQCARRINQHKQLGKRVVAVGTTVARALESSFDAQGLVQPTSAETDIFIYPGFRFRVLDALITNFHLSQSTLLMLVSAFAGRERILSAYQEAIRQRYKFFSYGDAMLLEK